MAYSFLGDSMFLLLTIGLALSMDTFSLALSMGTLYFPRNKILFFTVIVGIFHFFFPLISHIVSNYFNQYININTNKLLGIIFLILFIKLLKDLINNKEEKMVFQTFYLVLLAFFVSIDSFTVGFGINSISKSYILPSIIFFMESSFFTFLGLTIGKKASNSLGFIANLLGLILLFILSVVHLCK